MTLDVFWGGLFYNSCAQLELSLNWCTHNCAYCFANLNLPSRKAEAKKIFNFLTSYKKKTSYAAWLLQQGYPVLFSNHVDPFAVANEDLSLSILELFILKGIPFTLQTKGGRRVYDAIEMMDAPIVWYVSIATLSEEIAKKVEPGAPTIAERLRMVEKIIAKGHQVCVGINPCVPDWLPNPKELTDRLKDIGVWGADTQSIHLSSTQLKNMPARGQAALGEKVLHQALYRHKHPELRQHYLATRQAATQSGLELCSNGQGNASDYFQPYKDLYPVRFPLYQDFVNFCHANKKEGDAIYYEEFLSFFLPQLPDVELKTLNQHVYAMNLGVSLNGKGTDIYQSITNYETLLENIWQHSEISYCPVRIECFSWAADWEMQAHGEEGWTQYLDDNDRPILIFCPSNIDNESREMFVQWEPVPHTVTLEVC